MRGFALATLLLLSIFTLRASSVTDSLVAAPHLELRGGPLINIPGYWTEGWHTEKAYLPGPGLRGGAVWHQPLFYDFYLEPGLELSYGSYREYPYTVMFNPADGSEQCIRPVHRKLAVRLPLNLGILFNPSPGQNFTIFTGVEGIYTIHGHTTPARTPSTPLPRPAIGTDGLHKRFDLALTLGGRYYISRLSIGLYTSFGTLNLLRDGHLTFRENSFALTLGYAL